MAAKVPVKKSRWTCPQCGRAFSRKQTHSCLVHSLEDHFSGRSPGLKILFDLILKKFNSFGKFTVSPVKNYILLYHTKAFASFQVKKDHFAAEFFLLQKKEGYPVMKIVQISKNKFVHQVLIQDKKDLTAELLKCFRTSYDLAG